MDEMIQKFSNLMINDRDWSWSVIGILYLILTLIIRNAFMRPLNVHLKELKRRWGKEIKDAYSKHSIVGWFFYFVSFGGVLFAWSRPDILPLTFKMTAGLVLIFVAYLLSILFHVQALGLACAEILRRMESKL